MCTNHNLDRIVKRTIRMLKSYIILLSKNKTLFLSRVKKVFLYILLPTRQLIDYKHIKVVVGSHSITMN